MQIKAWSLGLLVLDVAVTGVQAGGDVLPYRYSMLVNLAAAQCLVSPELRRLRQCQEGFTLTIYGLRAETSRGSVLQGCASAAEMIPPLQLRILERIMPDQVLRDNYWYKYGTCTGLPLRQYYRKITQNASRLKVPNEFSTDRPVMVNLAQIKAKFAELNPDLVDEAIQLHCAGVAGLSAPVLTYARVCYTPAGQYAPCIGPGVTAVCPSRFIIYGRP